MSETLYRLVQTTSRTEFEQEVSQALADGWTLHGSPVILVNPAGNDDERVGGLAAHRRNRARLIYAQALMRVPGAVLDAVLHHTRTGE